MDIKGLNKIINKYDKILIGIGKSVYNNDPLPELYSNWNEIKKYNSNINNYHTVNKKFLSLFENKDCFVLTTSWGSHLEEYVPKDKLFTPDGNRYKLQCFNACTTELWDFKEFIDLDGIPTCPHCGSSLVMNISIDAYVVNNNYLQQEKNYYSWIHENYSNKILVIEWEVNNEDKRNIKDLFENIAAALPNIMFLRINSNAIKIPKIIHKKKKFIITPEKLIDLI